MLREHNVDKRRGGESPMTRPLCVWIIALAVGLALGQAAQGAVLCKKKSGAVVAREACRSKETALDLRQIDGGGGPGGGGEPSDGTIDHTSGSRLRVRYLAGADGSREFIGFFDNQRNENCCLVAAPSEQAMERFGVCPRTRCPSRGRSTSQTLPARSAWRQSSSRSALRSTRRCTVRRSVR